MQISNHDNPPAEFAAPLPMQIHGVDLDPVTASDAAPTELTAIPAPMVARPVARQMSVIEGCVPRSMRTATAC